VYVVHNVELLHPLFSEIDPTTDSPNHDIVEIGEFRQFSRVQNVFVKFVVIVHWENGVI
jgi:hypothetical protein